jgi:hypothetical protein
LWLAEKLDEPPRHDPSGITPLLNKDGKVFIYNTIHFSSFQRGLSLPAGRQALKNSSGRSVRGRWLEFSKSSKLFKALTVRELMMFSDPVLTVLPQ